MTNKMLPFVFYLLGTLFLTIGTVLAAVQTYKNG
jgi:hypothetical protein